MTDTSSLAATHSTTDPYPVAAPLNSPVPNGTITDSVQPEDDEPYTIKCICAFEDDDGNTVFCEGCETWQHIECYYHNREVPEVHNCTDCEPRHLDAKRATERQRRLREQSDSGDRKSKRSGTKSQKKKSKDYHHDQPPQVNGHHHRSESSSRDQPPAAKKPKTSHKASASVSSLSGSTVLQPDTRKRSGSTATSMSPAKSLSGPSIPLYSSEFLHLYDHDRGHVDMESNLFVNLTLAAELASWVKDPTALSRVVNGRSPQDIFTRSDTALDPSQWPVLSTESFSDPSLEIDGKHPTWKVLKTETRVRKDEIVGEVKGKIGLLRDYCLDPSNRWPELRHPQPFVFFHPQLPIYIDSREEGSILRYIRRSCRPNVTMKTFITNDVEYHFCFVANQDIPANSEITAMWYLDPQLFGSSNGLVKQEEGFQEAAAVCISNVLAHFGGCACDPPQNCLLANVDRRRHPGGKQVNGKRKKAKSKSNVSPVGAGRSNTSRAGSEGTKNLDDDDHADNRSTSGSVRGQTHSRDLTPTQTPHDLVFGDSELSARDRRKIAAMEKKFEQLEHDQQASQRKKKRSSGQSAQTTPTLPSSKQAGYFATPGPQSKPPHLDTGRSHSPPSRLSPGMASNARNSSPRKTSGSSNSPPVRSPLGRPEYVDAAHQTGADEDIAHAVPSPSPLRRHDFASLGRRLLKRCHEDRIKVEWTAKQREAMASSTLDMTSPPADGQTWAQRTPKEEEDVEMKDADTEMTPPKSRPSDSGRFPRTPDAMSKLAFPSPLPSTAAHNTPIPGKVVNGARSDLHVQLPPNNFSLPLTNAPGSITPASLQSPSGTGTEPRGGPVPQKPGTIITAPSPVKKKLSLGDYLSRRGTLTTPTSEKSQAQGTPGLAPSQKPVSQLQSATPPLSTDGQGPPQAAADGAKSEGSPPSTDVPMKDVSKPPPSPPPYVSSMTELSDQSKIPPSS
ncbi:hypothetical protein VTN77DRAFT_7446 [Rasamsonia byssochlamydoides]|uniref:uncharacterized protein n=1 Tax=Rasamsonia byssochlamydoides TaxID=89139 RepID=UPI003741F188